jgi:outer membrane lipoprotein SlyB
MRLAILAAAAVLAAAGTADAGCLKGAVVGGVAGHFAGRHATLGAVGGCVVGHHIDAERRKHDRWVAQGRGFYDAHGHYHNNH